VFGVGPCGLLVACVVSDVRPSGSAAKAWRCVPGRDGQAWIEIEWPAVVSFDTVRVRFMPDRGSWNGVARSARAQVSSDRVQWAFSRPVFVPKAPQEAPPRVASVTLAMERVNARFLRVSFPDGGIGGFVRVIAIEAFKTTRGEKGESLEEGANLALASLGARSAAESSASADEGPEHTIDGVAEPADTLPVRARIVLGALESGVTLVWGDRNGETHCAGLPPSWARVTLDGAAWVWDGQAGYVLCRPADLVAERVGRGLWSLQAAVDPEGLAFVAMPRAPAEDVAAASMGGRIAWLRLTPDVVWVEDRESGVGWMAAFDAVKTDNLTTEGRVALVYHKGDKALRAYAAKAAAPTRVTLDVPELGSVSIQAYAR
jgi:hypothetical protein